jgi:hypothetical protein
VDVVRLFRHVVKLQPDEHEQRGVQQEVDDVPRHEALQPDAGRDDAGPAKAHEQPACDRGERARGADLVGRDERCVAAQQGDRDAHLRVLHPRTDPRDDPSHDQADRDPARRAQNEPQARLAQREAAANRGGHRHLVGHERRGVVEQALALDPAHEPAREADATHDQRACQRIGGRHHRAQHERRRPRHVGHEHVGHPRDRDHREQHEADRYEGERAQVGAQVAEVGEERRAIQEWREEDHEDHIRVEVHRFDARHEAEQRAADDEHDGIGDRQDARQGAEARDAHQDTRDQEFRLTHWVRALCRATERAGKAWRRPPSRRRWSSAGSSSA